MCAFDRTGSNVLLPGGWQIDSTATPKTIQIFKKNRSGPGTGSDNPEPANIVNKGNMIAYWDSPGPNVASFLGANPSQIYVVQNFTGWIAGDSVHGGTRGERLCDVAAWHSVVNIANSSWGTSASVPTWQRVHGDRSGTGWVDPSKPPAL